MTTIQDTFTLPSGLKLKNRLVKAAMTENLSDEYGRSTKELENLYGTWATESGCGMLLSGNFQVDRRFLERERNVCIDLDFGEQSKEELKRLRRLAKAGKLNDTAFIAQISHGGRQCLPTIAKKSLAPSAKSVPGMTEAIELSREQIERIIEKFVYAAKICKEVGFDGIQLHSAHGYLLSSFLNPLANVRTDSYGGSLKNRASLLMKLVRETRKQTGEGFTIGVKLNSSDFQKGGFSVEEAAEVALMLAEEKIDFLELSGGNYEKLAVFTGEIEEAYRDSSKQPESTKKREAYFLDFAAYIMKVLKEKQTSLPLVVTGGFRTLDVMNAALQSGDMDFIGIGRPLCVDTACTQALLDGRTKVLPSPELHWTLPNGMEDEALRQGVVTQICGLNLTDIGYEKFITMSDTNFPNLLEAWERKKARSEEMTKTLKGYPKDDEFIQDFLKQEHRAKQSKRSGCAVL